MKPDPSWDCAGERRRGEEEKRGERERGERRSELVIYFPEKSRRFAEGEGKKKKKGRKTNPIVLSVIKREGRERREPLTPFFSFRKRRVRLHREKKGKKGKEKKKGEKEVPNGAHYSMSNLSSP